jgi:type II secretory pathway pseudopilin PulG
LRRAAVCALLFVVLACGRAERDRARDEAALRVQLASMRNAIAAYTKSHGQGPSTLRDAMPTVPVDPLTHSATTWRLTTEETVKMDDFTAGSTTPKRATIIEVHSGAAGSDRAGKRYSEY